MAKKILILNLLLLTIVCLKAQIVNEGFETGDFSAYSWQLSGNGDWYVVSEVSNSGNFCARSAVIDHNQSSYATLSTENSTPAVLSFYWRVNSEMDYDFMKFSIDGQLFTQISGVTDWQEVILYIPAGNHSFEWSYIKDVSVSNGDDCGWIDDILFTYPDDDFLEDLAITDFQGETQLYNGISNSFSVNVSNHGNSPQGVFSIDLVLDNDIIVYSEEVTHMINPGEIYSHELEWTPENFSEFSVAELTVSLNSPFDENIANNRSNPLLVTFMTEDNAVFSIGESGELGGFIPVNPAYNNSMSQTVYYDEEISVNSEILGIIYHYDFVSECVFEELSLWIGTTELDNLASGWAALDSQQQVFNDEICFQQGEHFLYIQFSEPFIYDGGNLIVTVVKHFSESVFSYNNRFFMSTDDSNLSRSRALFQDVNPINPNQTENGIVIDSFANTIFIANTLGTVFGSITNENGNPIENAYVSVNENYHAISDSNGFYSIGILPSGDYGLTVTATGYQEYVGESFSISGGESLEMNITLDFVSTETPEVPNNVFKILGNFPNPFTVTHG
ncbi:MAG: carboxypeptidase regulatory-like domain-containing protein, partial [Candidatus Cloacimonetes bacterium]|nr:carboxypeptidase regulatory-like domain-containing protein [Candidatus Cloacimonadota bacterium]